MSNISSIEQLGYRVIGCAMEAHTSLGGCGLLESVYEEAFAYELSAAGIAFQRQVSVPIKYKDVCLTAPLRIDLYIEEQVIVECKATLDYNPVFEAQLLTNMRLTNTRVGYVVNFGEVRLKNGIHRVVNDL